MDAADTRELSPVRRRLALAAVLAVAAALRGWRLDQNGFDNEYYAAAVRSMSQSWHNFFYNSFDPVGFVSVDKPPVALWVQVVSVRLLGFHWWSVLLPQVLEGLACVGLIYHLVRRQFGTPAGLRAGLFMAVTPVSVAIDRSDLSAISRRLGGEAAGQPVADWVRTHGTLVEPALWRPDVTRNRRLGPRPGSMELYDLRPEARSATSP